MLDFGKSRVCVFLNPIYFCVLLSFDFCFAFSYDCKKTGFSFFLQRNLFEVLGKQKADSPIYPIQHHTIHLFALFCFGMALPRV